MIKYTKHDFENAINNTKSMKAASEKLDIRYDTFRKYAQHFGLFKPNQSGKEVKKSKIFKNKEDVFRVFEYDVSRSLVKNWFLLEKEYKCECCKISTWNKKHLVLELEHINGNRRDNRLENLKLLCPNCHSQTVTWRKRKRAGVGELVDPTDLKSVAL